MKIIRQRLLSSLVLLTTLLVACQKEADPGTAPEQKSSSVDSTGLIKNVRFIDYGYDGTLRDSITDSFEYDTVNGKITIREVVWSGDPYDSVSILASYDQNHQLVGGEWHYPAGYSLQSWNIVSFQISYDADKIVKQQSVQFGDGRTETRDFQKTTLSDGRYRLNWIEKDAYFPGDLMPVEEVFDANGRLTTIIENRNGYVETNNMEYNAAGDLTRSHYTNVNTTDNSSLEGGFVALVRETKGEELYDQQHLLLNGIHHISFPEDDWVNGCLGVCTYFTDGYELAEYTKHPIITGTIEGNPDYSDFTCSSEFDNRDRLVSFNYRFFDYMLFPQSYHITYYK